MKIVRTLNFVVIIGLFGLLISTAACNKETDPFANFNSYDQELGNRIETYDQEVAPNEANAKKGNPALYIDFSSGINKAFNEPAIKQMMADCFNTVLAQKFDVYKLGSRQVTPLSISNTTQLGEKIADPKEYQDIWAPIQSAVEKIVATDHDALLITDFEEWQENTEITNTAFLKMPFSKWIEKGNSIHFFIANFKEGTVDKHLYFTVFNCGTPNAFSLISKLELKLGPLTTRFDLSNSSYKLYTSYPTAKSGGIFYDQSAKSDHAKNILDLKSNYINGLNDGNHFEFYPFGLDWENIAQLHATYQSKHEFNDFFRKLFIDLSNEDSYTFGDFDVKVSDISADFESFSKTAEAKKHKPKLITGSNGEAKVSDKETDPIVLLCYDAAGKLKEQYSYKPQIPAAMNEVFTLNKTLFTNTKASNTKAVELGVSFDPKFDVKNIQNPDGLLKVDVLLSTANPNLTNPKLSQFQWTNAKNVVNSALYESIKNTLLELKPANKIVYAYYIKTKQ